MESLPLLINQITEVFGEVIQMAVKEVKLDALDSNNILKPTQ